MKCPYCNKEIEGRTDKMFCDDRCRTNYYYQVNSEHKSYIRTVNRTLLKNCGILRNLNPSGRRVVTKQYLEEQGFDFNSFTSIYTTRKGKKYYVVYDQAYSFDDPDNVTLLVFYRDAESIVG